MICFAILLLSITGAYTKDMQATTIHPNTSVTTVFSETTTIHPDTLIKRYQMECIEETRADPDCISNMKTHKWEMDLLQFLLVEDWALCVLMKSGVMTKEGVYRIDVAMQRVPLHARYLLELQIDACLTPKPLPAKRIAFLFIRCFQRMKSKYSSSVSAFEYMKKF